MTVSLYHNAVEEMQTEKVTNSVKVAQSDRVSNPDSSEPLSSTIFLYITFLNSMMMIKIKESKCWLLASPFLSKYRENQDRITTRPGPVAAG